MPKFINHWKDNLAQSKVRMAHPSTPLIHLINYDLEKYTCTHDIACPVCWDRKAVVALFFTYRQRGLSSFVQVCTECRRQEQWEINKPRFQFLGWLVRLLTVNTKQIRISMDQFDELQ